MVPAESGPRGSKIVKWLIILLTGSNQLNCDQEYVVNSLLKKGYMSVESICGVIRSLLES